jgi:hypothetical protein
MEKMSSVRKHIAYVVLFASITILIGGGLLIWQYWLQPQKKAEIILINETLDRVKSIESLQYDLVHLSDGMLWSEQSIWRKGKDEMEKGKIEEVGESPLVTIWNYQANFVYLYSPETKKGKRGILELDTNLEGSSISFLATANDIRSGDPRIVGKEILDGKETLVIKTFNEGIEQTHWIWIKWGLPIRTTAPVVTLGGRIDLSQKNEIRRENIEVNIDISDDLFELPANIEVTLGDNILIN